MDFAFQDVQEDQSHSHTMVTKDICPVAAIQGLLIMCMSIVNNNSSVSVTEVE